MHALNNLITRLYRSVALAFAGVCLMAAPVAASCLETGLMLEHTQIRATAPNAPVSAGYLQITNMTGQTQTLVSAAAPFSQTAEIHDMKHENGVMKMHQIDGGLVLPDGLTVALQPKGRHLMFMGLDRQLKPEQSYQITLTFTPCGDVTMPFLVVTTPGQHKAHKHSHSHNH